MSKSFYSKNHEIKGYVLTEEILRNLEEICINIIKSEKIIVQSKYELSMENGLDKNFKDTRALINFFSQSIKCNSLCLEFKSNTLDNQNSISIIFQSNGEIKLKYYGDIDDYFEFKVDKLMQEIKKCEPNSDRILKFIYQKHTNKIQILLGFLLAGSFLKFIWNIMYVNYAKKVGVNISKEILIDGNSYYEVVDKAYKNI